MTETRSPRSSGQKLKSLEGIFGIVLLSISILGLIFTLVLPWYSYDISMEYDTEGISGIDEELEEISSQSGKITVEGSYTFSELESRTVGNYLDNGTIYVLVGFIILMLFSLIFLIGLFSDILRLPASMLVLGTGHEEGLTGRHLNSLNSIAALFMWFPITLVLYGASRFVGAIGASDYNYVSRSTMEGNFNVSASYSTVCGNLFFLLGLLMLGGVIYYLYRTWLKPVILNITSGERRAYVKKGSIMMIAGVILLTLGLVAMPMFSMIKEEITGGDENYELFYMDGDFHNVMGSMEDRGVIVKDWEDVTGDLSLMQWTLFIGIILSLLVLIGFSINLANPKYTIAPLLQLCVLLVVVAGIIFIIGQIMLWVDAGDLGMAISTEYLSVESTFGNNYFPFIFSFIALGCAVYASIVTVPPTFEMFKGAEYGEVAGTAAGLPLASGGAAPRTPVYSGFSSSLKAKKKPIVVSLGIVAVIVVGILIFVFGFLGDENVDKVNVDVNVVFNPDNFDLRMSQPDSYSDYATEDEEYIFYYSIAEEMVAGAKFRLTWIDEDEMGWIGSAPNRENQPDSFIMIITSPGGNITVEGSATNAYKEEGALELYVLIPENNITGFEGTGGWEIVLQVNAGDHEPKYAGGTKFIDRGNDFNLEIVYDYYIEKGALQE